MKKPEVITYKYSREPKGRPVEEVLAKPKEITKRGDKYKVTLDILGKKCHVGYYKTLEYAQEALEEAKRDSGYDT